VVTLRANRLELYSFAGRLRWGAMTGLGGKVEGNAKHIGIFNIEEPLLIQLIRLVTQGTANHLLVEELCAKRANAEYVGKVLATHPSVSMETETTQRIDWPSRPFLPTVFITSRSRS